MSIRERLQRAGSPASVELADPSAHAPAPQLGVVLHVFYPHLLPPIVRRLQRLETPPPRVLVTTVEELRGAVHEQVHGSGIETEVVVVENRGRDVWPFLQVLPRCAGLEWDVVLKLHTKESDHREDGNSWRDELLDDLLAPDASARIISAFRADRQLGMVGPTKHRLATAAYIGANRNRVAELCGRLGVETLDSDASFFAGTMFYVRLAALGPLGAMGLDAHDFEPEAGQIDGTLAHALERCFPLAVETAGFTVRATRDLDGSGEPSEPIRSGYPFARETTFGS